MNNKLSVILVLLLSLGLIILVGSGTIAGIISHTSTVEFCVSCHEMETTVYQEYKKTSHYRNNSGVRASCSDCHVPHSWGDTMLRKLAAAKDVYHHLLGTVDTIEKFEAKRLEMAEKVWASMKASNSSECRNCHSFDAMTLEKQRRRAQKQHENALEDGSTCIDCHKGIAHKPVHEQKDEGTGEEELLLEF